jgi:hypothetical protein
MSNKKFHKLLKFTSETDAIEKERRGTGRRGES